LEIASQVRLISEAVLRSAIRRFLANTHSYIRHVLSVSVLVVVRYVSLPLLFLLRFVNAFFSLKTFLPLSGNPTPLVQKGA
jgi:hypothetical protein